MNGAAGGGKSYVQLLDNLVYAITYPKIKQLVLRRTFPELERSLLRTMLELYPKGSYSYNSSKHTVTFNNGSLTDFGYCDKFDDVYKYQSAEYDIIRIDECTHFTGDMYLYLKGRIRGVNNFPKQMKCSTNPGNVGHQFFKDRFIDRCPPMEEFEYFDNDPITHKEVRRTRMFIPAKVSDNKFLIESDPNYALNLQDLPENERKALLDGSWDLYEGQFFSEFDRNVHVVDDLPLEKNKETGELTFPKDWRIYTTMDYGLDMFALYFIAVDNHENGWVFGEIYKPNVIISDAAKMIKDKQKELHIKKVDEYLAPSDMWNRRQETGLSVADLFAKNGIRLRKTSRDRVDGWAATKEWLKPFEDEQGIRVAKLRIHKSCVNLIRCLPALQYDDRRPSDVKDTPHEITHAPDALRGFCVYRSRANKEYPKPPETFKQAEDALMKFNSNAMFDVYGDQSDDGNNHGTGDYNPMYL